MSKTTTPAPLRRTVAYIRVSTEEQATEGYSLDAQERSARAYAVAREWPDVAEVYADAGVSGATRDRPALKRLLAAAAAGTIGRLVVTKLDRIGRRAADILAIEEELDAAGVERMYIKDSIDTSTPVGRMLRTVLAAVAELERDMILERTKSGLVEKARKGEVWRSRGVYGYTYLPSDKKAGTPGRLDVDPATTPVVQRIFTSLAAGTSASALAVELTAEGVPSPRGGAMWSHATIAHMVKNPLYTGRAAYGRAYRILDPATGRKVLRWHAPDSDSVAYMNVPALVPGPLAEAARARLAGNRQASARNAKRDYLLGGRLLTCGVTLPTGEPCGCVMHGDIPSGRQASWYRCTYVAPTAKHERHNVPAAPLEHAVWDALRAALLDPSAVLANLEALADSTSQQAQDADAELARLDRAIAEQTTRQDALLDMRLAREIDADAYTLKRPSLLSGK